jgi:transcription initiation factor TFIIB
MVIELYDNKSSNIQTTISTTTLTKCPSCGNEEIITDTESGEIICDKCGRVISDKSQDLGPEWRTFTTDETDVSTRTGVPQSLARHDMGLSTIIGRANRDASGNKLDPAMRTRMNRLATWDMRSKLHTPRDRSLKQAFFQLDVLRDKLGLSEGIVEKTAYIYRKAQSRNITRGRTVSGTLAAAIYIACREMGAHRTLDDIATACNIKRKELSKDFRVLHTRLDLKIPPTDPMKCIAKVANKVKLSDKTKRKAVEIMSDVMKEEISAGKDLS